MLKISLTAIANILSIGVNALLIVLKLVVGIIFNSISLIADGLDSVLDVVSATIAGIGEKISRKPPDKDHPFGHQKFQLISSLVIVITMIISSYFIAEESIKRLIDAIPFNFEIWVYNPYDLPNKIKYRHTKYKNGKDFINAANLGQGYIPAFDNLTEDTLVFPFNYVTLKTFKNSEGAELRLSVDNHEQVSGSFGTCTFYTLTEDE